MIIKLGNKKVEDVGTWQEFFVPTCVEELVNEVKKDIEVMVKENPLKLLGLD